MAIPRVNALGLALLASPAQPGHFVLQEAGGDQQAQPNGQRLQRILNQGQEFFPIQRQLDLPTCCLGLGPTILPTPLWESARFA